MIRDTLSIGPATSKETLAREKDFGFEGVRDRADEKWGGAPEGWGGHLPEETIAPGRFKVTGA